MNKADRTWRAISEKMILHQGQGAEGAGSLLFARLGDPERGREQTPLFFASARKGGSPIGQFRQDHRSCCENCGRRHPKPNIPVPVVRIVPVANRTAHIVRIVVESAAAQHTAYLSLPPQLQSPQALGIAMIVYMRIKESEVRIETRSSFSAFSLAFSCFVVTIEVMIVSLQTGK
jgi:hypothetical protein